MFKNVFVLVLGLLFCLAATAQTDMVITKYGTTTKGKIIEKTVDHVKIITADSVVISYPSETVRDIKYNIENEASLKQFSDSMRYESRKDYTDGYDNRPYTETRPAPAKGPRRAESARSHKSPIVQRNIGIGLLSAGGGLIVIGGILIGTSPSWTTSSSGGYYGAVNPSPAAAVGVLCELAAIPLVIVGAVQLSKGLRNLRKHKVYHESDSGMHF